MKKRRAFAIIFLILYLLFWAVVLFWLSKRPHRLRHADVSCAQIVQRI